MSTNTIYTIGHSNRALDEFISLLKEFSIHILVDVRATPYSGRFPHFSQDVLRETVNAAGIDYHWVGRQLGGNREASDENSHPALENESLKGFAEYMYSRQFDKAIEQLIDLASNGNTAVMCAEKMARHCHRSLISDYLTLKNINIIHIVSPGQCATHLLSPLARPESARLIYDRQVSAQLKLH